MGVVTRGERELGLRFDRFPADEHDKLEVRIRELTLELQARVAAAAPFLTGKLRSEISSRVYADAADRVAGYVAVVAQDPGEYPKAATLEYGTDKPRHARETRISARLTNRNIAARLSKPVHLTARRYLRDPLLEMRPEIEAALSDATAETVDEANA